MDNYTDTPLAEAPRPPEPNPPLTVDAIYLTTEGTQALAISETELVLLSDPRSTRFTPEQEPTRQHLPGSPDWNREILYRRDLLASVHSQNTQQLDRLQTWVSDLGQALLEKAEEKNWCSEYDEFADEWDLPKRKRPYEVNVRIDVLAANAEDAEQWVRDNLSISPYDEGVEGGPYYDTHEA